MTAQPFEWIADADSRLGPVVEAMISGRYFWIPVQNIRRIKVEPPTDLRDLVWLPVHFTWTNEGEAVGLIPSRYPGSESSQRQPHPLGAENRVVGSRPREPASGWDSGCCATEESDYPLLDIRQIDLVRDRPRRRCQPESPWQNLPSRNGCSLRSWIG